jgi:hypothetical protein
VPAGQSLQLDEPEREYFPAGHLEQTLAPTPLKVPAIKVVQTFRPATALKVPFSQRAHEVAAVPAAMLPAGHERHVELEGEAANVPTPHSEHAVAPAVGLDRPATQGLHGEPTPGAKVPTGQMVQIVLPAAVLLKPDSHA